MFQPIFLPFQAIWNNYDFFPFLTNFCRLVSDFQNAHLDIDTCAGQAWVGLRVHLGQVHGDQVRQEVPRRKNDSPSRQRRRARRAAEREAEEASNIPSKVANSVEHVNVE